MFRPFGAVSTQKLMGRAVSRAKHIIDDPRSTVMTRNRHPFVAALTGLLLASLPSSSHASDAPPTPAFRALVIGIADYEHAAPLPLVRADLNRVTTVLFEHGGYQVESVVNQAEPPAGGLFGKKSESEKLRLAVEKWLAHLDPGDTAILYFSGWTKFWDLTHIARPKRSPEPHQSASASGTLLRCLPSNRPILLPMEGSFPLFSTLLHRTHPRLLGNARVPQAVTFSASIASQHSGGPTIPPFVVHRPCPLRREEPL